jgi:hypothetical protein
MKELKALETALLFRQLFCDRLPSVKNGKTKRRPRNSVTQRLLESERLFEEAKLLTPYPFRPLVKSFSSFAEYHRWKRAQKNPWYR